MKIRIYKTDVGDFALYCDGVLKGFFNTIDGARVWARKIYRGIK